MDKKVIKAINIYNDELKEKRNRYLEVGHVDSFFRYVLNITPFIISILFVIFIKMSWVFFVVLYAFLFILYLVIMNFKKDKNYQIMNDYLSLLKRNGFNSIEEYENIFKNSIFGEGKYADSLLKHYIDEYKIDNDTVVVTDMDKKKYYMWCDQNYLYLLNTLPDDVSLLKKIRLNDVYYFRKTKISTIIKCSMDVISLDIFAFDKINALLPEKKFENLTAFEPDKYISDYELYMHRFGEIFTNEGYLNTSNLVFKLFLLVALSVVVYLINLFFGIINIFVCKLVIIGLVCIINYIGVKTTDFCSRGRITNDEIIDKAKKDVKVNEMFRELKVSLGVYDDYDKVYTNDNACYVCWVKNGYFHVFLDEIYFNSVYMVINLNDVEYYYLKDNEVLLKTKLKTLSFRKDAKPLFDKILPNKDYEWLKGLTMNK